MVEVAVLSGDVKDSVETSASGVLVITIVPVWVLVTVCVEVLVAVAMCAYGEMCKYVEQNDCPLGTTSFKIKPTLQQDKSMLFRKEIAYPSLNLCLPIGGLRFEPHRAMKQR